jgi:hypothetical protein
MDPYNYQTPQKNETMFLSTLKPEIDHVKTHTRQLNSTRNESYNLNTQDIPGKIMS